MSWHAKNQHPKSSLSLQKVVRCRRGGEKREERDKEEEKKK
jgi:hypothetical protein